MTTILYAVNRPSQDGTDIPANGTLECSPTRRRDVGDAIVLPSAFTARLVDGVATLDLAPTGPGWAWQIVERANRGKRRTVLVPESATPVPGADLIDVDPATLEPDAEPEAAWWAANDAVLTAASSAVAAGQAATTAAQSAIADAEAVSGALELETVARQSADAITTARVEDVEADLQRKADADTIAPLADAVATKADIRDTVTAVYARDSRRLTVAATPATITLNAPPNGAYTRAYLRGTSTQPPATWPIDPGHSPTRVASTNYEVGDGPGPEPSLILRRFMIDRDRFVLDLVPSAVGSAMQVYIDGQPQAAAPIVFTTGTAQFVEVVQGGGSTTPRLVEVHGDFYLRGIYTIKPGTIWRPPPLTGPKLLVVGDSFVQPSVMNTPTGSLSRKIVGAYQRLAPMLGLDDLLIDGRGGTGYLRASTSPAAPNYRDRLPGLLAAHDPDIVIVHGGGANDLFHGSTVAAIVAQAVATFTETRDTLPDAKLIFVEGIAPPGFTPAAYNPDYIAIRQAVQVALAGVGVYYIDVATTDPWIKGAGHTGAVNADAENANLYIGSDAVHATIAGHEYLAGRLAPPLRRILRDNGQLLNTLIR